MLEKRRRTGRQPLASHSALGRKVFRNNEVISLRFSFPSQAAPVSCAVSDQRASLERFLPFVTSHSFAIQTAAMRFWLLGCSASAELYLQHWHYFPVRFCVQFKITLLVTGTLVLFQSNVQVRLLFLTLVRSEDSLPVYHYILLCLSFPDCVLKGKVSLYTPLCALSWMSNTKLHAVRLWLNARKFLEFNLIYFGVCFCQILGPYHTALSVYKMFTNYLVRKDIEWLMVSHYLWLLL